VAVSVEVALDVLVAEGVGVRVVVNPSALEITGK
jgi:hypothetical protein